MKFLAAECDDKLLTQNKRVFVPGGDDNVDIDLTDKLTSVVQVLYKDRCQGILFKRRWLIQTHIRTGVLSKTTG